MLRYGARVPGVFGRIIFRDRDLVGIRHLSLGYHQPSQLVEGFHENHDGPKVNQDLLA